MIRALIADDEHLSRRALQQLLARHDDIEIVAECREGVEARDALDRLAPDVAFLDIRMPLVSGLDVARTRGNRGQTLVVFVTAFDRFARPAFDVDAADYLMKPLVEDRFDETLERIRARVLARRAAEGAVGTTPAADRDARHLVAHSGMTDVIIPLEAIDYIQADDVYAAVVSQTPRAKRVLVRTSLDALEGELDPERFVRVHRSYIVRLDRVVALRRHPGSGGEVVLRDGTVLPVSRRRRARVARSLAARR